MGVEVTGSAPVTGKMTEDSLLSCCNCSLRAASCRLSFALVLSELAVCPFTDNAALSKIEIELLSSLITSSSSGVGWTLLVSALEARLNRQSGQTKVAAPTTRIQTKACYLLDSLALWLLS